MNLELIGALTELEKERGISKDILLEAIEVAIVSAYKRNYGSNSAMSVRVEIIEATGEIHVYSRKVVVPEVSDGSVEISEQEAQQLDPNFSIGDVVEQEVTPKNFGRIAAQTAKQVVIQRIREAERSIVYDEYSNREGDVVTGLVQRQEHRNVIVDLGKVEAVLPTSEQIPNEPYVHNARMKFFINEVKQSTKGPQVFLSRTHPGLLKSLFEFEVPEIQSGEVEIKAVAREAGFRSKVAVYSRDASIDPVGACVGAKGSRVQAIVAELYNEKIDIMQWVPEPEQFISNALSPAKVLYVRIEDGHKVAHTVVPDDQLSLAIGKEGQNARLAARLTGWKIDIKSEKQAEEFFKKLEPVAKPPEEELLTVDETELPDVQTEEEIEPASPQPTVKEIDEEELAALKNIGKRKSWSERFGDAGSAGKSDENDKQEGDRGKKKKKKQERVIKDFSMLDLEDFSFDDSNK